MDRKRAVAIGYATIDYVVELEDRFTGCGTSRIRQIPRCGWPRPGGAALYACRELARAGIRAAPLTWTGTDDGAGHYESACRQGGLDVAGIVRDCDAATASCVLIYQPDGGYGCLFDPGLPRPARLHDTQKALLEHADLVLIAVAPPELADAILEHVRDGALVAWIAKGDRMAVPPHVRRKYAARADYIFCNELERRAVESSIPVERADSVVIIETRGHRGVRVCSHGREFVVKVDPLRSPDTTGAGDTFAGAVMASILNGREDLSGAVAEGVSAAGTMLRARAAPHPAPVLEP